MLRKLSWLVFTSLVLIFLDKVVSFNLLRGSAQQLIAPVEYGLFQVSVSLTEGLHFIWQIPLVYRENQSLRNQLKGYYVAQVENESLREENTLLRRQLKVQKEVQKQVILAKVLGLDASPNWGRLIINRGRQDGVSLNSVAVLENFLLGKVVRVQLHQSVVETIFSPESKISVRVGRVEGLLQGEFGSKLTLTEVPPDATLVPGALILTTGSGGIYPPDLILGRVAKVIKDDRQPYLTAQVEPLWHMSDLKIIFLQP